MSESTFHAKRVVRTYRQTIDAKPEVVFPLLCPVREAEWLDGWRYSLIYSDSGLVEEGAVFRTPGADEEDTVWIVTRHDPAARRVEFARFTPGSKTCLLRISVEPSGEARSHVDVSYTYTSLAPSGERFLEEWTETAFRDAMTFWEESMNHFLKAGGRLARRTSAP